MKPQRTRIRKLGDAFKAIACVLPLAQAANLHAQVTNWVAYNDYLPSPQTAANVTGFDLWNGPGGNLINFVNLSASGGLAAGTALNVALAVAPSGTIAVQGTMLAPAAGTPADVLFNGIVDLATGGGFNIARGGGGQVVYTFSGLNPTMAYSFQATGARGRETDPTTDERWAKVAVAGYSYLNDASTPGCTTLATYPAAAGALGAGEAAFNVGRNATAGDVVGWNNIIPGPSGTITVTLSHYTGPINKVDGTGTPLFGNGAFAYSIQGFRMVEILSMPVAILANPVASTTLKQLDPLSLSVKAEGSGLQFQWFKGPTALSGATSATFALAEAAPGDSGDYTVVVSNSINSRTSTVAHVTVNADTVPPQVVSVGVSPVDPYGAIRITFDEIIDGDSAIDLFNYTVKDAAQTTVSLGSAVLSSDGKVVTLAVDPNQGGTLAVNASYTVTMREMKDRIPNTLPATTVPFTTWPLSRGFIRFDYFAGLDSGNNVLATTLLADPRFPYQPSRSFYPSALDSRTIFPDDTHEGYGFHITGFFIAPTNGDYQFFLKSDDSSQLYFNPAGMTASGKVLLTEETSCCGQFSGHASGPQTLVGGQAYYIEANLKEGTGGDFIQIAMKAASDASSADSLLPVSGAFLAASLSPLGAPTVTIVQNPVGATNQENSRVSFSVTATNSAGAAQFYVWRKNGEEIPLANTNSYLTPPTQPGDDGALFDVVVYVLGGSATSTTARLGVLIDTIKPTIDHISMNAGFDKILITFSELVDSVTATDPLNYTVTGPDGPVPTGTVTLLGDGKTVAISIPAGLAPDAAYTVSVSEVTDLKGNAILAASTAPVTSLPLSLGFVKFDYFPGIGGNTVSDLTSHPSYINETPASSFYLSAFDSHVAFPDTSHESFGGRMTGVFIPPTSGNWIFYIASDDSSQLWLNPTGPSAAGATLLTEETSCCHGFADHASSPQTLTAGDTYYIQALYKEGTGGDFCQVAAKLETDVTPPNFLLPIPGNFLGVYLASSGSSVQITQQPVNAIAVSPIVKAVTGYDFSTTDGGFLVENSGPVGGPWIYDAVGGYWSANGTDPCATPSSSTLASRRFVVDADGDVVLRLNHRYNFEADTTLWDGGQIKLSINEGPFFSVTDFAQNGYSGVVGGNNIFNGQNSFTGQSPGYGTGANIDTDARLGTFVKGDQIRVQLIGAWDECTRAGSPNWLVKRVAFTSGTLKEIVLSPATFTVAATGTFNGAPATAFTYFWQKSSGGGFTDIIGATGPTLTVLPEQTDNGALYRCQVFVPGASAISASAKLTVGPDLDIAPTGFRAVLSWPVSATGFTLQQTSALLTPSTTVWENVGVPVIVVGDKNTVTVTTIDIGIKYYRLVQ